MKITRCHGCGGQFPEIDGPVHRYMDSSPGCWAAFGEVLAREFSDPTYFEVHRLTVDTYAVQHPGSLSRQSIQSIGVHLIRLCLFLEYGLPAEGANDAMLRVSKQKHTFTWLEPPTSLGELSVIDVLRAEDVLAHKRVVRSWAQSAWEAWSVHHNSVRQWISTELKI